MYICIYIRKIMTQNYDEPKTRREKKKGLHNNGYYPYSSKHIRLQEQILNNAKQKNSKTKDNKS